MFLWSVVRNVPDYKTSPSRRQLSSLCIALPIFTEAVFSNENSSLYYTTNFNDPTVICKQNTFVMILKHSYNASEGHHNCTDTLPTNAIMQFQLKHCIVQQMHKYIIHRYN